MTNLGLNPRNFQKNPEIINLLGFQNKQDYIVVRIVNHGNTHDVFGKKWDYKNKMDFIEKLSEKFTILISSEIPLPKNLKKYRLNVSEEKFHQTLAHAKMVVGESATVAMESAILGIPALFIDFNTRGYITEVEKDYRLIHHVIPTDENLDKSKKLIAEIMQSPLNSEFKKSQQKLLSEKVDISEFFVWFIENYPESART